MKLSRAELSQKIISMMAPEDRKQFGKMGLTQQEIQKDIDDANEKEMQETIHTFLRSIGITPNRSRMDMKSTGVVGWPDFTFAINGHACVIECKMPGKQLRPEQIEIMKELMNNGWSFRIAFSSSEAIHQIREWMEKFKS